MVRQTEERLDWKENNGPSKNPCIWDDGRGGCGLASRALLWAGRSQPTKNERVPADQASGASVASVSTKSLISGVVSDAKGIWALVRAMIAAVIRGRSETAWAVRGCSRGDRIDMACR